MNNVSVNLKWEEMIMTNDNEKNKGTTRAIILACLVLVFAFVYFIGRSKYTIAKQDHDDDAESESVDQTHNKSYASSYKFSLKNSSDSSSSDSSSSVFKTQYSGEWQNDFDGWDEAYKNWEDTEVSERVASKS